MAVTSSTTVITTSGWQKLLYPRVLRLVDAAEPRHSAPRPLREFLLDLDPGDPIAASPQLREFLRDEEFVLYEYEARR